MRYWHAAVCATALLTLGCSREPPPAIEMAGQSSPATSVRPDNGSQATVGAGRNLEMGERYYRQSCASCHDTGVGGTPRLGDIRSWEPRIALGLETLVRHAIDGYGSSACAMPPRGGHADLHIEAVALAVCYMIEMSLPENQRLLQTPR
jgi:cytochrome c5